MHAYIHIYIDAIDSQETNMNLQFLSILIAPLVLSEIIDREAVAWMSVPEPDSKDGEENDGLENCWSVCDLQCVSNESPKHGFICDCSVEDSLSTDESGSSSSDKEEETKTKNESENPKCRSLPFDRRWRLSRHRNNLWDCCNRGCCAFSW